MKSNSQSTYYWMIKLKKKINFKKITQENELSQLGLTHQTHNPSHETRIIS